MTASKWKPYQNYIKSNIDSVTPYPSHWELKRVKYLIKETDGVKIGPFGSSLKLNTLTSDGIKIYGQGNVIKNDFTLGHRHLPIERFNSDFSQYEILDGDVLITMMGTTGKSKVFRKEFKRGIIDSHLIRLRFQKNQFNSDLFVIILQESEYMFNQLKLKSNGSIMEGLNSSIVKDLYVVKPPIGEQKQIERFLHRANEQISHAIENLESQKSLIEEKRSAIITQAVTRGLNPDVKMMDSEIEWIEQFPTHWMRSRIRKASSRVTDGAHVSPDESSRDIPFVSIIDITNGIIDFENSLRTSAESFVQHKKHNSCPKPCDVLYSKDGTIGVTAVISEKIDFVVSSSLVIISPITDLVDSKYLDYWLRSNPIMEMVERVMSGSALRRISVRKVGDLPILLPPVQEQLEIVEYLDTNVRNIKNAINFIVQKIYTLKEYRTALISSAVTGKIDVRGLA